jgi:enoyl-CoA hydratase
MTGARQPDDDWDEKLLGDASIVQVALLRGFELYKPVIAAINGFALAGGTEIIQVTDLRLAVPHAEFGLSEVKRGLLPAGGSTVRLARQIPYCKAMEILLTGGSMPAEEAHRIGLINEIVAPDRLLPRAEELAQVIAENGPLAVQSCKASVLRTSGVPLDEALQIENEYTVRVFSSEDAIEGPRAFIEKRKPSFKGR